MVLTDNDKQTIQGNRTTKPLKSKNRLNCEQKENLHAHQSD